MATDGRSGVEVECSRRGWGCGCSAGLRHRVQRALINDAFRCCQQHGRRGRVGLEEQGRLVAESRQARLVCGWASFSWYQCRVNTPVEGVETALGGCVPTRACAEPKWGMRPSHLPIDRGPLAASVIHFQNPVRKTRPGGACGLLSTPETVLRSLVYLVRTMGLPRKAGEEVWGGVRGGNPWTVQSPPSNSLISGMARGRGKCGRLCLVPPNASYVLCSSSDAEGRIDTRGRGK